MTERSDILLLFTDMQCVDDRAHAEAYVESAAGLDWKKYDPIDQGYLRDPDAGFLFQDYPSYEFEVAEYLDETDPKSAVGG